MSWKKAIQNQINGMNIAKGGTAIRYQPIKVPKIDKPLLVIGLGGTGLRIGRDIKDMFFSRFSPANPPIKGLDERLPAFTRFLAIDTDEKDMNDLGYMGDERCTIGNADLANQLAAENRNLLPSYISDWLNPNVVSHDGNGVDGAQGVRQIGRFDLFTNVKAVVDSISKALKQISSGKGNIQVVIAAGVAGGTGAGTFMDMPYLVRYAADQLSIKSRVSIMGILVTPELYAILDPESTDVKRANGYACLKELDYWMDCVERRDSFTQQYSPSISVEWNTPPFEDCLLLSSQTVHSDSPAQAYDTLRGVVAEYITNMFADEERDKTLITDAKQDFGFSYSSYRSNVRGNLAPKPRNYHVTRRYTAIGASNGQIPLQDLLLAETVYMFNKVEEYYDAAHTPDMYAADVYTSFLQDIVSDRVNTLLGFIHTKDPRTVTIDQIRNSANLAPHSAAIDATVTAFHDALESRAKGTDALALISQCVQKLQQNLVDMFMDVTKGPFYTSRFIDSTPGVFVPAENDFDAYMPHNFNLKLTLESLRAAAQNRRSQANNDYKHQVSLADAEYQDIRTNMFAPRQNGAIANRYYTACDNANLKIREYWYQDTMVRLYDAMIAKMEELSKQVFLPLCKTMLELVKVYKEIGVYMTTSDYTSSRQSYYRDIVDLEVMIKHFKNHYMTDKKTNQMLEKLYADMMRPFTYDEAAKKYPEVEPKEMWLITDAKTATTSGVNVRDNLERVANEIFRDFNTGTLLEFWKLEHPEAARADGTFDFTTITDTLVPKMTDAAAPMFLPSTVHPLSGAATLSSEYITVPKNTTGLKGALASAGGIRKVKESSLADHIFWIRSLDGVCLYHYGDLANCEKDYLRLAIKGGHPGSHLWENKINWKDLPNPLPRGARPDNYSNPVQEAADAAMIERIDALLACKKVIVNDLTSQLNFTFNKQLTRDQAAALLAELKADALSPEKAEERFAQVLGTREAKDMTIESSVLSNYETKYAGQDPQKQVVYDMLMQYPAMIETMEKDVAALAELEKAVAACVSAGKNKTTLLGMASRMADLFAFGILTRPTPMHVNYTMDGAQPQTVYNTMKDNAKYAVRYHAAYANEVCVAAKLMDMEDANHEEHGKMVQLKMLEDQLANDLEGAVMELLTIRLTAFGANAQALKTKLAAARNAMLLASPMTLKMTPDDKQMCLDFLQGMMDALDARAMGFGMMLV